MTNDYMQLKENLPLKVISSAVHNAGMGWYNNFINRSISPYYNIENVKEETFNFYRARFFIYEYSCDDDGCY